MEKREANKRTQILQSETLEPAPKKKRYASKSANPTKATSNLGLL